MGVMSLFKTYKRAAKEPKSEAWAQVTSSQNPWTVQDSASTCFISNMVWKVEVLFGSRHFI